MNPDGVIVRVSEDCRQHLKMRGVCEQRTIKDVLDELVRQDIKKVNGKYIK